MARTITAPFTILVMPGARADRQTVKPEGGYVTQLDDLVEDSDVPWLVIVPPDCVLHSKHCEVVAAALAVRATLPPFRAPVVCMTGAPKGAFEGKGAGVVTIARFLAPNISISEDGSTIDIAWPPGRPLIAYSPIITWERKEE